MPWVQGDGSAQDFIYRVLRRIGHLRPGYLPSPEMLQDALTDWVQFFDELGAERNTHYSNPVYQYQINGPGSATNGNGYTVGPGGDFDGPRPESIIRANLVFTDQGPNPVYIQLVPISQEEWAALSIQQIPATNVTNIFWYDPQWPLGVFNVFPPLNQNSIQIYQWGVLVPPAALSDPYTPPPGYRDGVVYGLAKRLYYMVTKEVVVSKVPYQVICANADHAWAKIKRVNRPIPQMANDFKGSRSRSATFYDSNVTRTGSPY